MTHLCREDTAAKLRGIPDEKIKEHAQEIFKGLIFFEMMKTTDPKKAEALDQLTELRLKVQECLDVIAPGWAEG